MIMATKVAISSIGQSEHYARGGTVDSNTHVNMLSRKMSVSSLLSPLMLTMLMKISDNWSS